MCLTNEKAPQSKYSLLEDVVEPVYKLWELQTSKRKIQTILLPRNNTWKILNTDRQYWMQLSWKLNKPELPTNYGMAFGQ